MDTVCVCARVSMYVSGVCVSQRFTVRDPSHRRLDVSTRANGIVAVHMALVGQSSIAQFRVHSLFAAGSGAALLNK